MNVKRISKGSIHRDPSCSPLGKTTDMKLAVPECESTPEQFVGAGGIHSNSSDLKGGLFEFNTAQRAQPVRFNSTDTNKYDVIQDYRQKVSLKNEPYDIKSTHFLTERNTPSRQNIDTFIKRGQDRMNSISAKVKAFLAQSSRNDRIEMLEAHSIEGLVRTKLLFPKQAKLTVQPYLWSIIDYGNRCIYYMAIEDENGKYYLFSKKPDHASFKDSKNLKVPHTIEFRDFETIFKYPGNKLLLPSETEALKKRQYLTIFKDEKEFYSNVYVRNAFLDAKETDFIDRSDVVDVEGSINAVLGIDPNIDVPFEGIFAQKFAAFLKKEELIDAADPNKKNQTEEPPKTDEAPTD